MAKKVWIEHSVEHRIGIITQSHKDTCKISLFDIYFLCKSFFTTNISKDIRLGRQSLFGMALADIITCPILGMMTQFDQPKWHLLERYVSLQIRNPAINTTLLKHCIGSYLHKC